MRLVYYEMPDQSTPAYGLIWLKTKVPSGHDPNNKSNSSNIAELLYVDTPHLMSHQTP